MRLHHLEVTAFGPFADTVHVDFDELYDAGLFLLTGPTGAGKTSVLDAVCFALYGDVPGDRSAAKRLALRPRRRRASRPEVVPRGDARRAAGSGSSARPPWERPKKRGTGTTTAAGVGDDLRARRRRLGAAVQPARRGRPPGDRPGRA